jgi:hypothetical protein
MSITPQTEEYPRRVKELYEDIQKINGNPITAAQSRHLVVKIAETTFDQWDYLICLHEILEKHVAQDDKKKKDAWEWTKQHLLPDLVRFIIVGIVAWVVTVNGALP